MQKITPFLWFDDNAEEAMIYTRRFSKALKLAPLLVMTKQHFR